jgi:hypothetical protein
MQLGLTELEVEVVELLLLVVMLLVKQEDLVELVQQIQ